MGFDSGLGGDPGTDSRRGPAVPPLLADAVVVLDATAGLVNCGTAPVSVTGFVTGVGDRACWFGGNESDAVSCPDANALDLTAGFVALVDFEPADWTPALPYQILAKPLDGGLTVLRANQPAKINAPKIISQPY